MSSLLSYITQKLEDRVIRAAIDKGEVSIVINPEDVKPVMLSIRDDPVLAFKQLVDLCGVDYHTYTEEASGSLRYAVVYHLLSLNNNQRLRVKCFCLDNDFPMIDSVIEVWPAANWFEREAFDLFGIHFAGHPDLRRLLTDYGFVGHPFRKDFPISGYVEMRFDPESDRVVYEPVSIEQREVVPRVIREEKYGRTKSD